LPSIAASTGSRIKSGTAQKVVIGEVLVPLPPYSPELNPVQWVWEYMKERFLSLRLHNDACAASPVSRSLQARA